MSAVCAWVSHENGTWAGVQFPCGWPPAGTDPETGRPLCRHHLNERAAAARPAFVDGDNVRSPGRDTVHVFQRWTYSGAYAEVYCGKRLERHIEQAGSDPTCSLCQKRFRL